MYASARYSALISMSIVCIRACKAGTQATTAQAKAQEVIPVTTITASQGGRIVYDSESGAGTQAAAMSKMLSSVHNNCGEKPRIGRVFQFTGSKSVGVFFTVTD